ncbi:unnamed protein product, partial [Polarella glacialis]
DGAAAGILPDIQSCQLDWEQDALLLLGSESFWNAFHGKDVEVGGLAMQILRETASLSGPLARRTEERTAERLLEAAKKTRQGLADDVAVSVLRFTWVD